MKKFTIYDLRFTTWGSRILWLAALLLAGAAEAAPLRVTTWNIEPNLAAGTNGASAGYRQNLMQEAAEVLTKLHPDVIVLQGVPDWPSCADLVKALKPTKYYVATWSSFRDASTSRLSGQQTAILSRGKAYISWSEPWRNASGAVARGGFAFAAIKTGGRSAGFFSVQLGENESLGENGRNAEQQAAREESARQLLAQIDSLNHWTTNRIQALVVAGDFNTSADEPTLAGEKTLPLLKEAGLADAFGGLPLGKRITLPGISRHSDATADYIFTRDAKPAAVEIVPSALTEHYPVTCDLDLEMPPVQMAQTTTAELPVAKARLVPTNVAANIPPATSTTEATIPAPAGKERLWWIAGIATGGVLVVMIVWKLAQRRPRMQARPAVLLTMKGGDGLSGAAERIVIAPQSADTTGSAADHPPIVHIEAPSAGEAQLWRQRAEEAERRAARARAVARHGLMAHLSEWLKGKIVQRLTLDRAQLLEAQRTAVAKMQVVDERLAKIESQIGESNRVYEKRIEELEQELIEAREENRELIQAKIMQVKAEMEKERADAERRAREQG
jgi:endonuclease/exonuclease/phosphatase family metal-dependent hydrolase